MPQLTKVSVSYGETRSYGNYSNRRADAAVEALIIEGEEPGAAFQELWDQATNEVKFALNREEQMERERCERELEEARAAFRRREAERAEQSSKNNAAGDAGEPDPDSPSQEDDPSQDDPDMPY